MTCKFCNDGIVYCPKIIIDWDGEYIIPGDPERCLFCLETQSEDKNSNGTERL